MKTSHPTPSRPAHGVPPQYDNAIGQEQIGRTRDVFRLYEMTGSRGTRTWTRLLFKFTLVTICGIPLSTRAEPLPNEVREFLTNHCLECHSGNEAEASVRLDRQEVTWTQQNSTRLWERVYGELLKGSMPPSDSARPNASKKKRMIDWLLKNLQQHSGVGGTVPRRLNRAEYENSIEDLFGFEDYQVPNSFPADDTSGGFDNVGIGLFLSPPLMAQYLQIATSIADEILPPDHGPVSVVARRYEIGPQDMMAYRDAGVAPWEDRFRLVSSKNMANSAAWPKTFEALQSGIYRLSIDAAAFETNEMFYPPRDKPLRVGIYVRKKTEQVYDPFDNVRKLGEFPFKANGQTQTHTTDIKLAKGEIFGIRWCDGPFYSKNSGREYAHEVFAERLRKNRRHYAAMLRIGDGSRGMTQQEFYQQTLALMQSDDLDMTDPRLDKLPENYGGGLSGGPHRWIKSFVHEEMFRFGPALDVIGVKIEGPLELFEDDEMKRRKARTHDFLRARRVDDPLDKQAADVLRPFLNKVFRRPVTASQLEVFVKLATLRDDRVNWRLEDGLHMAMRRALISPQFLYRSTRPGVLDDFDLATRLSFFLTSSPPDERLWDLASRGDLTDPDVLRRETERLLDSPQVSSFLSSFCGQWLGTRRLEDIMPDPRLLRFFDADRKALVAETEQFVTEILRENHPLKTFIDPDFSYRSARTNKIYGDQVEGMELRRISFAKGGRHGGILGLGSVMMATANGVDTHPVHRGTWVLENVLGMSTPPAPEDVPAIAPDTNGNISIREQLDAHRTDTKCASCHRLIDPLGLVLENFDPVGRWRDHYPRYAEIDGQLTEEFYSTLGKGTLRGPKIDAGAMMPDGSIFSDVTDLKRYVVENIDSFSKCLTTKLMIYATGRPLSFGDRQVMNQIVDDLQKNGGGFRDLILAVVDSESFRTK